MKLIPTLFLAVALCLPSIAAADVSEPIGAPTLGLEPAPTAGGYMSDGPDETVYYQTALWTFGLAAFAGAADLLIRTFWGHNISAGPIAPPSPTVVPEPDGRTTAAAGALTLGTIGLLRRRVRRP